MKIVKLDYSEYTLEQLQSLLIFLDKNKYPDREKEINRQIKIKQINLFSGHAASQPECEAKKY